MMSDLTHEIVQARKKLLDLWIWNNIRIDLVFSGVFNQRVRGLSPTTQSREHLDGFEVVGIPVDHSAPGALAYLIRTPDEKTILYTGDLRFDHDGFWSGRIGKYATLDYFLDKIGGVDIDVLILEGTHIDYFPFRKEQDVKSWFDEVIKECACAGDHTIMCYFGDTDIDRFYSIYDVARQNDFRLILNYKHYYIIKRILSRISTEFPKENIKLRYEKYLAPVRCFIEEISEDQLENLCIDRRNLIRDIRNGEKNIIVLRHLALSEIRRVVGILKEAGVNGIFIYSSSEPMDDEQRIRFEKVKGWLYRYGLPIYHIHASGHAHPIHLKKLVKETKPREIIPVHTEQPELFRRYIASQGQPRWIIPENLPKILDI